MKKMQLGRLFSFLLIIYTLLFSMSIISEAREVEPLCNDSADGFVAVLSDDVKVGSRILDLFFGERSEKASHTLVPGGEVFGVKLKQKYVSVTESKNIPALKRGDIILSINGKAVTSSEDVARIVRQSGGECLTIIARHGTEELKIETTPSLIDGEYKLGISLKDSALGIGTITYIDPETGVFGGLGHGISDAENGEIISMESGEVCGVILGGVHKGECGKPGELTGVLTEEDIGDLFTNTECGVFGILDLDKIKLKDSIPIATRKELKEGEATILSTLKNGKNGEYKIKIFDIKRDSDGSKSFKIKITDPTLKSITGGIVRGMSGSPIIQNGKLVGAVTHVMVADPTEGYGIFIENMLSAANEGALPKVA